MVVSRRPGCDACCAVLAKPVKLAACSWSLHSRGEQRRRPQLLLQLEVVLTARCSLSSVRDISAARCQPRGGRDHGIREVALKVRDQR